MLKKLFALFRRKKEVSPPKPERRPSGAVPPARMPPARSYSSGRPAPGSQPSSDNPIYTASDDDCRRSSHEPASSHCSGSSWGGSDSGGSSSSSDSGSSSSSSCD